MDRNFSFFKNEYHLDHHLSDSKLAHILEKEIKTVLLNTNYEK